MSWVPSEVSRKESEREMDVVVQQEVVLRGTQAAAQTRVAAWARSGPDAPLVLREYPRSVWPAGQRERQDGVKV